MEAKDFSKKIKKDVWRILLKMFAFLIMYLPLVLLGVFLIVISSYITYYLISETIEKSGSSNMASLSDSSHIGIVLLIALICLTWLIPVTYSKYIFRPLFSIFKKHKSYRGMEIRPKDAPKLFELIYQIAKDTGNRIPKHVYVSSSSNACVFYNRRRLSLFYPCRKNIVIGLGLLQGLSVREFSACLGHEFGHFSQDSMRMGEVVFLLNNMITKLAQTNQSWSSFVRQLFGHIYTILFGVFFYLLTRLFMYLLEKLYKGIQIDYCRLSRTMEYEADSISARLLGKNTMISSLLKINYMSIAENRFLYILWFLANENIRLSDYWGSKDFINSSVFAEMNMSITYKNMLSSIDYRKVLEPDCEEIYCTHPTLYKRIKALQNSDCEDINDVCPADAFFLVPNEILTNVAVKVLDTIERRHVKHKKREMGLEEFKSFIADNYDSL